MLGHVAGKIDTRAGYLRPCRTSDSVHYGNLTPVNEGNRLQFAIFDASYLERLQRGEPAVEQHFVGYFSELIRLKLRSRLKSREAVEDVRQETFARVIALVRAPGGIKDPERLGPLVNSVCNNVLLEQYRSNRRSDSRIEDEPEHSFVSAQIDGPGLAESRETARAVREILGGLPARDRRLLQAVLLEERDKDEVCAELGLTRDYLRVLVHRAKQSFRSFYLKRFGELE